MSCFKSLRCCIYHVAILTFMSRINFVLSWVEHEKVYNIRSRGIKKAPRWFSHDDTYKYATLLFLYSYTKGIYRKVTNSIHVSHTSLIIVNVLYRIYISIELRKKCNCKTYEQCLSVVFVFTDTKFKTTTQIKINAMKFLFHEKQD